MGILLELRLSNPVCQPLTLGAFWIMATAPRTIPPAKHVLVTELKPTTNMSDIIS